MLPNMIMFYVNISIYGGNDSITRNIRRLIVASRMHACMCCGVEEICKFLYKFDVENNWISKIHS